MKLVVLGFAMLVGLTASLVEFASDTLAAEFPTTGFAYNTLEPNFLQYECYEQGSILECSFTQGRINRKLNPSDVSKKLDEARKQYPNIVEEMKNEDKKFCHGMPTILEAFRSGKAPKEKELAQVFDTVSNLGKEERKVAVELLEVLSRFCLSPTEKNWVAIARQSSEKEV